MQGIAAEIHQRPAVLLGAPAKLAGGLGDRGVEFGRRPAHLAERAGPHHRLGAADDVVEAVVEGLDEDHAARLGRFDHGLGLAGVDGEGLLAQHRLAGLQGGDGPRRVADRRQAVVDDIDILARHEVGVSLRDPGDAVLVGIGPGARRIARRDGGDDEALDLLHRRQHRRRRDARCAQQPNPENLRHGLNPW